MASFAASSQVTGWVVKSIPLLAFSREFKPVLGWTLSFSVFRQISWQKKGGERATQEVQASQLVGVRAQEVSWH